MKKTLCSFVVLLLCVFIVPNIQAQAPEQKLQKDIKSYLSLTREVVYLHLNKTLFLQGEQLGFSAYVLNKKDLKPSLYSTNLYVQITNADEEIVKQELLLVENGVASSVIDVDSTFTSGNYKITAFTNWMQNFQETNFFSEDIRVLEFNTSTTSNVRDPQPAMDIQFLPESGHLLKGVPNLIGVIAKDSLGRGVSNAKVIVKDGDNIIKDTVSLNRHGIGKFELVPGTSEVYKALVLSNGKEFLQDIELQVESEGIILSSTQNGPVLQVKVTTNEESLPVLQEKVFFLTVSGRSDVESFSIKYRDQKSIPVTLDMNNLEAGVNTITLFDSGHRPIAERLIFNYNGLPIEDGLKTQVGKSSDSLEVRFSFDAANDRNLSVSILPQNTISNHKNYNIISHYLLQSFVKGAIENGGWYFEEVDKEKKEELDKLLLTQGWSSYDWQTIFQKNRPYAFERHFELKVNLNGKNKNGERYMVHSSSKNPLQVLEIPAANDTFVFEGFLPVEGEKLNISRLRQNDQLEPAKLWVEFSPNKIPEFRPPHLISSPSQANSALITRRILAAYEDEFTLGAEDLGEVMISTVVNRVQERERKLAQHSFGSVSVITEKDLLLFGTLGSFLNTKNLTVTEENGSFSVTSSFAAMSGHSSQADPENPKPVFDDPFDGIAMYLDDNLVSDLSIFHKYPLQYVDYVEINKTGMGSGFVGSKGSIRVYSKATKFVNPREKSRMTQLDFPLAYSAKKVFYTPKYENTNDEFFEQYGVIDWIPDLQSREGADVRFMIKKPGVDFQLIVEGITTDGQLIHQVQNFPADD